MPLFRRFLSVLFVLFTSAAAFGQDSTMIAKNTFGIGFGYGYSALKNEKFSPLTQSGSGVPVQAYFRQSTPKRQAHFQLLYSTFSLSSNYGVLVTGEQNIHFQSAYHYRLGKRQKKITTWIGFVSDGQVVRRTISSTIGNGTAGNNTSNEGFVSLDPSVLFEKAMGNKKLSLQVWASVIAYVVVPEAGGRVEKNIVSIGSFSKTETRLSYSTYFNRRWEGRLDGQFQFYALSIDQPVYKINTTVIASIAYRL